jgi:hypothetical protein
MSYNRTFQPDPDRFIITGVLIAAISVGYLWHTVYVSPREAVRSQIIQCMNGDRSQQAYEYCVAKLKPRK